MILQRLAFALLLLVAGAASLLLTFVAGLSVMAFDAPKSGQELWPWVFFIGSWVAAIGCWICVVRAMMSYRRGSARAAYLLLAVPIGLAVALLLSFRLKG